MALINIWVALKSGRRTSEHNLAVLLFETLAHLHCITQETTYQLFPTPKQFSQDFRIVDCLLFEHLSKVFLITAVITYVIWISNSFYLQSFSLLLFSYRSLLNYSLINPY